MRNRRQQKDPAEGRRSPGPRGGAREQLGVAEWTRRYEPKNRRGPVGEYEEWARSWDDLRDIAVAAPSETSPRSRRTAPRRRAGLGRLGTTLARPAAGTLAAYERPRLHVVGHGEIRRAAGGAGRRRDRTTCGDFALKRGTRTALRKTLSVRNMARRTRGHT